MLGSYPEKGLKKYEKYLPAIKPEDFKTNAPTVRFLCSKYL